MLLDAFEIGMVDINEVEIDKLHALSIGVEWPHRAEDWRLLRELGRGWAAVDAIGRVLGSVMWFPMSDNFALVGMGITTPRLQERGANTWMMQQLLEQLKGYNLGLVSTHKAHGLFLSLGFADAGIIYRRQGAVPIGRSEMKTRSGSQARAAREDDLDKIIDLDEQAFCAGRAGLLSGLLKKSTGYVLERDGKIVAFALCRPFGRGYYLGPIVAASHDDAIAVSAPHIKAHESEIIRVDTQVNEGRFVDFLDSVNITTMDTSMSMWKGQPLWGKAPEISGTPVTFAFGSQSFG